jgi:dolichol-phosphate mannosyltransferase
MCSSNAPCVAVMDADMQHDERILPQMLEALRRDGTDLVVGSRYTQGGSTGEMPGIRAKMSRLATWIGARWLRVKTTDPMSGFFMLRRSFLYEVIHDLSGTGFKILLDVMASARRDVNVSDIPYDMRARQHGDSKLDTMVLWEYLMLLCEKSFGKLIPVRFVFFVMMGSLGALLHLAVLLTLFYRGGANFFVSQAAAVVVAMTANFFFNNLFTYADRRLKGARILRGILIFYLTCAGGAVINLAVAVYLYDRGIPVAIAGLLGAAVGAIWNYTLSTQYAWRQARSR